MMTYRKLRKRRVRMSATRVESPMTSEESITYQNDVKRTNSKGKSTKQLNNGKEGQVTHETTVEDINPADLYQEGITQLNK